MEDDDKNSIAKWACEHFLRKDQEVGSFKASDVKKSKPSKIDILSERVDKLEEEIKALKELKRLNAPLSELYRLIGFNKVCFVSTKFECTIDIRKSSNKINGGRGEVIEDDDDLEYKKGSKND